MPAHQTHTAPEAHTGPHATAGAVTLTREALTEALAVHDKPWPDDVSDYMRDILPPVALLDRLAKRYARVPVPACFVCGGELEIQQIGGGEDTVWAHGRPAGVSFSDWAEHYDRSRWIQRQPGDADVLALVAVVSQLLTAPDPASTTTTDEPTRSHD